MNQKNKVRAFLIAAAAYCSLVVAAMGGTVIVDTVTYSGANLADIPAVALPKVGYYMFDLVVTATPTASSAITGFTAYVQQQGVAGGNYYTLFNSTFTTCNAACSDFLAPDMYVGGNVRGMWAITTGSATVKMTAREITP